MMFNIVRVLLIFALSQCAVLGAAATETRIGFHNFEFDDSKSVAQIDVFNNITDTENTLTQNGVTNTQRINSETNRLNVMYASERKSGVRVHLTHSRQKNPIGHGSDNAVGANYELPNQDTRLSFTYNYADNVNNMSSSNLQGVNFSVGHEIALDEGELQMFGSSSFVFNHAQLPDGHNHSSFGLKYFNDTATSEITFESRFSKSRGFRYNSTLDTTTVLWSEETSLSGTYLNKFEDHRLGMRYNYTFVSGPFLSDKMSSGIIWIFDQPNWQTRSELFWAQQKYKSDNLNLRDDENTFGLSLRYVRQINQTASFHIGGTFSNGSKSSRHPHPVNATEARAKIGTQKKELSLGILYQF